MQGNIVSAARWIGVSLMVSSCILVSGLRWSLTDLASPSMAIAPVQISAPTSPDVPTPVEPMTAEDARKFLGPICAWLEASLTPSNPTDRVTRLLQESEDLRKIEEEWEKLWFAAQKSPIESGELLHAPRSE